jgi:hypothetical protein
MLPHWSSVTMKLIRAVFEYPARMRITSYCFRNDTSGLAQASTCPSRAGPEGNDPPKGGAKSLAAVGAVVGERQRARTTSRESPASEQTGLSEVQCLLARKLSCVLPHQSKPGTRGMVPNVWTRKGPAEAGPGAQGSVFAERGFPQQSNSRRGDWFLGPPVVAFMLHRILRNIKGLAHFLGAAHGAPQGWGRAGNVRSSTRAS